MREINVDRLNLMHKKWQYSGLRKALALLLLLTGATVIAVPYLYKLSNDNYLDVSTNDLINSFSLAKKESLERSVPVTICGSQSQVSCDGPDQDNDKDHIWDHGWIVFVDARANGVVDKEDEILSAVYGLPAGMILQSTQSYLQFKKDGTISDCNNCKSDNLQSGNLAIDADKNYNKVDFLVCDMNKTKKSGWKISIFPSGQITQSNITCS
ncbi:MAG: GspH/FimT family protein [Gammaproteobacteria bacterium]|nr:GspH/FimT family protein [Gammaproteobacteria bacterium]